MISPREITLAKRAIAKRKEAAIAEKIGHLLEKTKPEPKSTPCPLAPVDSARRKHMNRLNRGCSGFQHHSFLNQ